MSSDRAQSVVAFGGGHGLAATLQALRLLVDDLVVDAHRLAAERTADDEQRRRERDRAHGKSAPYISSHALSLSPQFRSGAGARSGAHGSGMRPDPNPLSGCTCAGTLVGGMGQCGREESNLQGPEPTGT